MIVATAIETQAAPDTLARHRAYLRRLAEQGGPRAWEHGEFDRWLAEVWQAVADGELDRETVRAWWRDVGEAVTTPATVQGFVCCRPHGYAGDFEVIDRIYTSATTPVPTLRRWDEYFHAQPAARAVRNRARYFRDWLETVEAANPGRRLRLLNVGSGPCRDVFEYLTHHPDSRMVFHCVDQDTRAIAHAARLCAPFGKRVIFHQANALRFVPDEPMDAVWSAGLFDYLNDRLFVRLLRRLLGLLEAGGEVVIGNFSPANPTQAYMELLGAWVLNHRSEGELLVLAAEAGVPRLQSQVRSEPEKVNMFLHLQKTRLPGQTGWTNREAATDAER